MISPVKIWRRQKDIRNVLGKRGKILTWTRIFVPPSEFKKQAPYFVVLVELSEGSRVVGQLVDCDQKNFKIGSRVIGILRKVREGLSEDVIAYGLKFRLSND